MPVLRERTPLDFSFIGYDMRNEFKIASFLYFSALRIRSILFAALGSRSVTTQLRKKMGRKISLFGRFYYALHGTSLAGSMNGANAKLTLEKTIWRKKNYGNSPEDHLSQYAAIESRRG